MPSVRIQPGHGGMNSESSPDYVSPSQAVSLENLLPRPGKVVLRGPISSRIDLAAELPAPGENWTNKRIQGAMSYGSSLYVIAGLPNARERMVISGTVTDHSIFGYAPGRRFCSLGDYVYSTNQQAGTTQLVRWDGTLANLPTAVTTGPAGTQDVTTHLSRLFTIGVTGEPNSLRWSDLGGATANTAAEWTDDVSGLTNQIIVGGREDNGRALGHCGKQLCILKDRSLWLLTGLTPSSFALQRVTSEWGCVSAESVVDHDDGCFFLSERGFAYFDGSTVTDVSEDIKAELLTAMRDAPLPYNFVATWYLPATLFPFARAASVGRDSIMLTIGSEVNDSSAPPTVRFCAIYDVRQRTWTKFSSDAFGVGAPVYFLPTSPAGFYGGTTLGYDGAGNLLYLNDLVVPESASFSLVGEDTVDGTTAAIPAEFHSRIVPLSSPTKTSQLKRLLFDYSFVVVSDADPTIDTWSISLVDGQGNVLLAPTAVQATILASGYTADQRRAALVRKRFSVECYAEASEVQLRVTLPSLDADVTEIIAAEIHDATIEFDPGRDRPTT